MDMIHTGSRSHLLDEWKLSQNLIQWNYDAFGRPNPWLWMPNLINRIVVSSVNGFTYGNKKHAMLFRTTWDGTEIDLSQDTVCVL